MSRVTRRDDSARMNEEGASVPAASDAQHAPRQSHIELLRIVLIVGVIVLHLGNADMGGGLKYAEGISWLAVLSTQSVFRCSVDAFMIISGYFLCTSNRQTLWKPVRLVFETMVFGVVVYVAHTFVGGGFSLKSLLVASVPSNYFVILYVVVYLLSPWTNRLLASLDDGQLARLCVVLLILLCLWPTLVDVIGELRGADFTGLSTIGLYGSMRGYSLVNFWVMYVVGAVLRRKPLCVSSRFAVLLLLASIVVKTAWAMGDYAIGVLPALLPGPTAFEYCNPFVCMDAVLIVTLFSRLQLSYSRVINVLASCSFGVYLLHEEFLRFISMEAIVSMPALVIPMIMIAAAFIVYLACSAFVMLYECMSARLFNYLRTRIGPFVWDIG